VYYSGGIYILQTVSLVTVLCPKYLACKVWHLLKTTVPSVLWCCWLGDRKGIRPVKNWVVGCWHGYLSGARCRLAYGQADATATHCLLLLKTTVFFEVSLCVLYLIYLNDNVSVAVHLVWSVIEILVNNCCVAAVQDDVSMHEELPLMPSLCECFL